MATYTVTLSDEDNGSIDSVRAMCERELLVNVNLNGATIEVEPGDFTSVDGPDEIVGAQLLADVHSVLRPE